MSQLMKLIFAGLFLSIASLSYADDATFSTSGNPDSGQWWLNGGLGVGGSRNLAAGFAGEASINYRITKHQLLTARATTVDDVYGQMADNLVTCYAAEALGQTCKTQNATANDYGLLYGLIAKNPYVYASISAGLAYVNGRNASVTISGVKLGGDQYSTIGIPGEVQAFLTPLPWVGIGVIGFGDLNNQHSSAGVLLALQVGKLR